MSGPRAFAAMTSIALLLIAPAITGVARGGEAVSRAITVQNLGVNIPSSPSEAITRAFTLQNLGMNLPSIAREAMTRAFTLQSLTISPPGLPLLAFIGRAFTVVPPGIPVDVPHREPIAASADLLYPATPNPTLGSATIQFDLRSGSSVRLGIYDLSGRLVRRLVRTESGLAGHHSAHWDGTAENGKPVPPGVYFVRLQLPRVTQTRRLVLLRD